MADTGTVCPASPRKLQQLPRKKHYQTEHAPVVAMLRKTRPSDYVTVKEVKAVLKHALGRDVSSYKAVRIVREHFTLPAPAHGNSEPLRTPHIGQGYNPQVRPLAVFGVGWKPEHEQHVAGLMAGEPGPPVTAGRPSHPLSTVAGRAASTRRPRRCAKDIRKQIAEDVRVLWEAMLTDSENSADWFGDAMRDHRGMFPEHPTIGALSHRVSVMKEANMIKHVGYGHYRLVCPERWKQDVLDRYRGHGKRKS